MNERTKLRIKQEEIFGKKMLPDICIDIMASLNGSSDPMLTKVMLETYSFFIDIIDEWIPNNSNSADAEKDRIVKELVKLTSNTLASHIAREYIEKFN